MCGVEFDARGFEGNVNHPLPSGHKGKGDRRECTNYRRISVLGIPGKIYGKILINKDAEDMRVYAAEEQGGFRPGRGCVIQVFVLKQLKEEYREKKKEIYVVFEDLEKV